MNTSIIEVVIPLAESVRVTDDELTVELSDGRTISVPLAWYPRLSRGTAEERQKWQFNGKGTGIHWPDLDEDISVRALILGRKSGESQSSLKKWLEGRSLETPRSKRPETRPRVRVEPNPGDVRYIRRDAKGRFTAKQVEAGRVLGSRSRVRAGQ
jgi:hypothetical protein